MGEDERRWIHRLTPIFTDVAFEVGGDFGAVVRGTQMDADEGKDGRR